MDSVGRKQLIAALRLLEPPALLIGALRVLPEVAGYVFRYRQSCCSSLPSGALAKITTTHTPAASSENAPKLFPGGRLGSLSRVDRFGFQYRHLKGGRGRFR